MNDERAIALHERRGGWGIRPASQDQAGAPDVAQSGNKAEKLVGGVLFGRRAAVTWGGLAGDLRIALFGFLAGGLSVYINGSMTLTLVALLGVICLYAHKRS
ncbi:MAG: hypothetical protein ACRD5H_00885 [Nitrososphaerales archaeon]